jgi:hypothetical protein
MGGRGNPDGIHWNFEAHQAVAELMLKALAEVGEDSAATMQWGYPQPRSGEGDAQRDEEEQRDRNETPRDQTQKPRG